MLVIASGLPGWPEDTIFDNPLTPEAHLLVGSNGPTSTGLGSVNCDGD